MTAASLAGPGDYLPPTVCLLGYSMVTCVFDDMLTGVTVTPLDDVSFQLFAPNTDAMDEAREMIEEFLTDEVT